MQKNPRTRSNSVPVNRIDDHFGESRKFPALLVIVSVIVSVFLPAMVTSLLSPDGSSGLKSSSGTDIFAAVVAEGTVAFESEQAADDTVILQFLSGRFRDAIRAYRSGQFEKAWKMSEAILVLAPVEFELYDQVNTLRRRAHGRFLSQSTVAVRFSIENEPTGEEESSTRDGEEEDPPVFPKAYLTGMVVLENLSDEVIQFGNDGTNEDVLGQVVWSVKDVYLDGTERTTSDTRVIRLDGGFRVEPGESRGIPVQLPIPVARSRPVLQQWVVTGSTRPLRISTPDGEITRGLPWIEERGRFVAPELELGTQSPREALKLAAVGGNIADMVLARYRWLERRREVQAKPDLTDSLIDEMVSLLGSHEGKLDRLIVGILEEVTGLVMERSARAWKIWGLSREVRRGSSEGR